VDTVLLPSKGTVGMGRAITAKLQPAPSLSAKVIFSQSVINFLAQAGLHTCGTAGCSSVVSEALVCVVLTMMPKQYALAVHQVNTCSYWNILIDRKRLDCFILLI
jgi:hypothetical protein